MARGFSHSGRGGGGRSGGGFSFGGGSSGRSYSSGGGERRPPRPRTPWHIPMFGRTVIISTGTQTLLSFLLLVLIGSAFCFFSFFGNLSSVKDERVLLEKDIAYMEELDATYAEIIDKAEDGVEGYQIYTDGWYDKGNIKYTYGDDPQTSGVYYVGKRNNQNWFFIVYYYDNYEKTDSTFTTFTQNDVNDFNGNLEIAVWNDHGKIWAINTGYKLADNMDYWFMRDDLDALKKYQSQVITITVISGIVFAGCIACLVFIIVKNYKKAKKAEAVQDAKNEAEVAVAQANAEIAQKAAAQKGRVCKYCGQSVPDGDEYCPGCGSRTFES